ncbi:kinetochore-associated protein DSN1 homolog isoform X1 [Nematostella vectensis]|uniref:kinetochore-associated protein DSN1 homolog isoform X1 n=1 Tax=Nematostella vectensis TaxID=45351 RepID=UPI00139054EF|nr:kinetochore-associated protein DSN1 homolog isoform X1 [Nematostella vectensis]
MADATSPPRKVRRTSEEHKDDGFQFTKKSRRAKTATVNLSTRKSASAKKTKRRRSSFVRGRNDRKSLLTTKSPVKTYKPDLCKDIPADLPLEHKLSLLVKASLQLVIDKLEGDSSDVDSDIPNFNEEAISVFKQLKEAVDDCEINKLIQQTADEQEAEEHATQTLEEEAQICSAVSTRLRQESEDWDQLLESHQEQAKQISKEAQEEIEANKTKDFIPDFLSVEQHQLLSGKPSLKHMVERMEALKQKQTLQVSSLVQTVGSLKEYKDVVASFIDDQSSSLGVKSLKQIEELGSPMSLISSRLNLPK